MQRVWLKGDGCWMIWRKLLTWANMGLKPSKSRSLVVRRGKLVKTVFQIENKTIPTILKKSIRCLGIWFNESMCTENIKEMRSQTNIARISRQTWAFWKFKGMELPTWHTTSCSVAAGNIRNTDKHNWGTTANDQQVAQKMA